MKRYDFNPYCDRCSSSLYGEGVEEDAKGDWVKFDDVKALIADLKAVQRLSYYVVQGDAYSSAYCEMDYDSDGSYCNWDNIEYIIKKYEGEIK
jgi:hypothetical protein